MKIITPFFFLFATVTATSLRGGPCRFPPNITVHQLDDAAPDGEGDRQLYTVQCQNIINDGIGRMRYCRNHNIYLDNVNVERAIIVIHGSYDRSPGAQWDPALAYYTTTTDEAASAGVDLTKTDVIAPFFFQGMPSITDPDEDWSDYYIWRNGWRWGDADTTHGVSSFSLIGHIIGQLIDHRPNLQTIVIAGQSAGGQFVDRYSAIASLDVVPGDVEIRFWAANPATYVWLSSRRPHPDRSCSEYNDYPFGLERRPEYYPFVAAPTARRVRRNAMRRQIYRSVGEDDLDLYSDTEACALHTQGEHHVEVWQNHRVHSRRICLRALGLRRIMYCVRIVGNRYHFSIPGCGHGHSCSWGSADGHRILFQ